MQTSDIIVGAGFADEYVIATITWDLAADRKGSEPKQ